MYVFSFQQEAEDLDDDAQYLKRLSGGLFTLQLIDRIILEVRTPTQCACETATYIISSADTNSATFYMNISNS